MLTLCAQKQESLMNSINRLSKIIYVFSILVSAVVFIVLPMILEKSSNDDLVMCSLRDTWGEAQVALPTPTIYALSFTDSKAPRILVFILFIVVGLLFELLCKNKLYTGIYHLTYLTFGCILGWFFLFACLVPYYPLGC